MDFYQNGLSTDSHSRRSLRSLLECSCFAFLVARYRSLLEMRVFHRWCEYQSASPPQSAKKPVTVGGYTVCSEAPPVALDAKGHAQQVLRLCKPKYITKNTQF